MTQSYQQLARSVTFLPCIFALLFALVGLSIATPHAYAARRATSGNWSGYEADGNRGSFNRGQIVFNVPSLQSKGKMSLWIGLGGSTSVGNNYVLVQAGVDTCLGVKQCTQDQPDCDPNTQCTYLWWEIAPALAAQRIPFTQPINGGDLISASVSSINGVDQFVIQDLTAQPAESHTIIITRQNGGSGTLDGQPLTDIRAGGTLSTLKGIRPATDGASAECIAERPFFGQVVNGIPQGSFTAIPGFSPITIAHCQVGSGNNSSLQGIGAFSNVKQTTMTASKTNTTPRMFASNLQGQNEDSFTLTRA